MASAPGGIATGYWRRPAGRNRSMRIPRGIGALGIAAFSCLLAVLPAAQEPESSRAGYDALALRPVVGDPPSLCGTPALFSLQMRSGFAPPSAVVPMTEPDVPDGPLWYDQNPRLLRADHAGGLAFDNFLVAGDVAALTFQRLSGSAENYVVIETWQRTGTTDIDGHLISVFNPNWDSAALWDSIGWQRRGFDRPWVQFGTLLFPRPSGGDGDDTAARFFIRLRVAPVNVPSAEVTRIDANTQYSSHVVNLVLPQFGDRRLSAGDYGYELDDVAKGFYAHFRDEYASIAIVPRQQHVVPYDGYHHNVRNPIAGLGALSVFDNTEAYGSAGVLRSVELFPDVSFTSTAVSTHEIGHQWVDYWDWSGLAGGIERAGLDPDSHTPLLFPGEVYSGAVLDVTRRVAAVGDAFAIERTPDPALQHPTTRYRMGLIGPEAVPEIRVFENQGQFNDTDAVAPAVGTAVAGGWRRVHVNDVLAEHGARSGPVDSSWSRVTVVVSRDGLLSQAEMSYWNFYAARHAATGGVTTWEGVPSFFEATGGAVPLRTDVTPLNADKIDEAVETGHMPIAPAEFRDVLLDAPVPALITAGESVTIAGAVTTTERDDFTVACAAWNRHGAGDDDGIFECASIAGNRFSIPYRFTDGDAGRHTLRIFLYFPNSGSQFPRSSVSGITVAGQSAAQSGAPARRRGR